GDQHHDHGGLQPTLEGETDARDAGAYGKHRDEIRHDQPKRDLTDARPPAAMRLERGERCDHHDTRTSGAGNSLPNSAMTVSPPTAVWPTATRGTASVPR